MEILKQIMVGKTFHRWTVLRETTQKNNNGNYLCLAQCKCGTKRMVSCSSIRSGKSKSCGCIASEKTAKRNKTHQKSKHPLYPRWNAMHRRCYLPSDSRYKYYGARGVTMCEEWKLSPQSFYDWFESQGGNLDLTVDRINTYGPYSPENCRLITLEEQQRNRRPEKNRLPDNVVLKIKRLLNEKVPVPDISKKTNVSRSIIYNIRMGTSYKNVQ